MLLFRRPIKILVRSAMIAFLIGFAVVSYHDVRRQCPTEPREPPRRRSILVPSRESYSPPFQATACLTARPDAAATSKRADGRWEVAGNHPKYIFVYSAFYDDRPAAGLLPQIRLVTMATLFRRKVYERVFCFVWYEGSTAAVVVEAKVTETGANLYLHNDLPHGEFTISCPLPLSYPIPSHVSLSVDDRCPSSLTSYTLVRFSPRASPVIKFGVCVANGYGSFKPEHMIEWFEAYISFGVSEFNLYNTSYTSRLDPVFSYYSSMLSTSLRRGVLNVQQLPHPTSGEASMTRKVYRNLRTVAMNDCLMQNMYRYNFIVTVDHDEIITPRSSLNYRDMLTQINADKKTPPHSLYSLTFQNLYFLEEFNNDTWSMSAGADAPVGSADWKLKTERFVHRSRPVTAAYYYATKSFVNPLFCFNLFNHYCSTAFPPYTNVIPHHVPIKYGASHHYKKCGRFYMTNCTQLLKEKTRDASSLRFTDPLKRNVINVYKKLRLPPIEH